MAAAKWAGVFPAVTTKFKENEDLDFAEMERHFAFQIDGGVHALLTCGSLGEASTLSFDEKLAVARTALDIAGGRVPVPVNVSETRTRDACRFAEQARAMGVQGLMVMPSVLYAADAREAKDNLRTIAGAAQLPIMVYNNPVSYKVDLTPDDFRDLADCEWIVAIKESSDNVRRITDLRNAVGERYQLFMGVDDLSFEGLAAGADGLLAGLVVAFPKETVAVHLDEGGPLGRGAQAVPVVHAAAASGRVEQAGAKLEAGRDAGRRRQRERTPAAPAAARRRARTRHADRAAGAGHAAGRGPFVLTKKKRPEGRVVPPSPAASSDLGADHVAGGRRVLQVLRQRLQELRQRGAAGGLAVGGEQVVEAGLQRAQRIGAGAVAAVGRAVGGAGVAVAAGRGQLRCQAVEAAGDFAAAAAVVVVVAAGRRRAAAGSGAA